MTKNLLLCLACSMSLLSVKSQVRIGIIGGPQSSTLTETRSEPGWQQSTGRFYSKKSGFHAGIMSELKLGGPNSKFYFQPAFVYSQKGRMFDKIYQQTGIFPDTVSARQEIKMNYFDIPLNLTAKLPLSKKKSNYFFISAGPYVSLMTSSDYSALYGINLRDTSTSRESVDDDLRVGNQKGNYKSITYGFNGRAGLELGRVTLSGFFSQSLGDIYNSDGESTFKQSVAGGSLGIWLGSTKKKMVEESDDEYFITNRVGIIAGPQFSSIMETNSIPGWNESTKPYYSERTGFHAGIMAEMPLSKNSNAVFFQPALMFSQKGRVYFQQNDTAALRSSDTFYTKKEVKINYVDLPLNFAYKFALDKKSETNFVIAAGPYLSFFMGGKDDLQSKTRRITTTDTVINLNKESVDLKAGKQENGYKTFDLGWNARAGIEMGSFVISGFMSQSLQNVLYSNYDGSFKNKVYGASVGVWLGSTKEKKAPKDADKDGVPDKIDGCPLEPGTAANSGCPDRDSDSVIDKLDSCPDIAGLAKYHGCPIPDSDKDGVNDEEDKCPDVAGLAKYNGCPIPDTDKDGVNDEQDKCPEVAGVAKYNGCPVPDSDNDGVNDEEDKCPKQAGTKENNGCPEIKQEIVEKVNFAAKQIFFAVNSDVIQKKSYAALEEVADILTENSQINLEVEGHSDNTGNADKNLALSDKRAAAVKQFLIDKGIDANRLKSTGYGQTRPIADNKTKEGKALNRRVELKLQ